MWFKIFPKTNNQLNLKKTENMAKDFVKSNDGLFVVQLNIFKNNLPSYAALFGLTPAQLAAVEVDADWMAYVIIRNNAVPGFAQDWTKFKNQLRHGGDGTIIPPFPIPPDVTTPPTAATIKPDVEGRFRLLVAQLKANSNYSKAIGENLGIEADETSFDEENYKPEGSAKAVLNVVTIKFSKKGVDGQVIYSKVTTGVSALPSTPGTPTPVILSQYTKIAIDLHSPYIDNRELTVAGQPELREYYLRGVLNDAEIGVPSDVIRVVVGTI
jgi:hypothetical protein